MKREKYTISVFVVTVFIAVSSFALPQPAHASLISQFKQTSYSAVSSTLTSFKQGLVIAGAPPAEGIMDTSSQAASIFSFIKNIFGSNSNESQPVQPSVTQEVPALQERNTSSNNSQQSLPSQSESSSVPVSKYIHVSGPTQVVKEITTQYVPVSSGLSSQDINKKLADLELRLNSQINSLSYRGYTVPPQITIPRVDLTALTPSTLAVSGDFTLGGRFIDSLASAGSNGYILQSTGSGATWVATSSLGFGGSSQWGNNGLDISYNLGNVGIGTSSPVAKLAITNDANGGNIFVQGTTGINNGNASLIVRTGSGSGRWSLTAEDAASSFSSGSFALFDGVGSKFPFRVATNTPSNTLVLASSGNVGVGTTNPQYPLQVNGTTAVGISYQNTSGHALMSVNAAAASQGGYYIYKAGIEKVQMAVLGNSNNLTFSMAGTPYMTLGSGGNLGLGTTSPFATLSVNAVAGATSFFVGSSTATSFIVNSAGNVGIGSTTPTSGLSIDGKGLFIGDSSTNLGYVQVSSSGRQLLVTGQPAAASLAGAPLSVNAVGNGAAGRWLFGLGVSNIAMFSVDVSGNTYIAGNVGIGTTTPGSLLSLGGIANFTTATSTFYSTGGINLAAGCYAVAGTCLTNSTASGIVGSGTTGQFPYYAVNGTTLSATSSVFMATNGYLGIGTTNPGYTLDVNGSMNSTGYLLSNTLSLYTTSNNLIVRAPATKYVAFLASSTEAMRIDTTGYVGIGTTTPYSMLSVNGNIAANGNLNLDGDFKSLSMGGEKVVYRDATVNQAILFGGINAGSTLPVIIRTSGADRLAINAAGNVGIGTSTPAYKLEVSGVIGLTGTGPRIDINPYGIATDNNSVIFTNGRASVGYDGTSGTSYLMAAGGRDVRILSNSTTEVARFTSGGNVGIGTSTPIAKFQVNGGDSYFGDSSNSARNIAMVRNGIIVGGMTTANNVFSLFGGSTTNQNHLTINSSGNVGIGTTTPTNKLDIVGVLGVWNPAGTNFSTLKTSSVGDTILTNGNNNVFNIQSGTGANILNISSAGNVGIGTSTPDTPLTVYGASGGVIKATTGNFWLQMDPSQGAFQGNGNVAYWAGATSNLNFGKVGTTYMTLNNTTGYIGIGTTTPAFPLDVYTTVSSTQTYGYLNSSGTTGATTGTNSYSIRAQGRVMAPEFNAVSDARLKNVQFNLDPNIALNAITQLQPVSFTWKTNPDGQPILGFLAQDVEMIIPNAVSKISTENFVDQRTLDYNQLTAVAIAAIKELNIKLNELPTSTPHQVGITTFFKEIFADKVTTKELCVGDADDSVCVTKDQLRTLLQNADGNPSASASPAIPEAITTQSQATSTATSTDIASTTPILPPTMNESATTTESITSSTTVSSQ